MLTPEVTQSHGFKKVQTIQNYLVNICYRYNYGLYHGQKKSDRKEQRKDIRMYFPLVNESLYNDEHCEDKTTHHLCESSCTTCSTKTIKENIKSTDTEESSLLDRYINDLESGFTVLGNLDLVGLVIIKNSYQ